jgi:hypothetical protein
LRKAIAKSPEERYAAAGDLARALAAASHAQVSNFFAEEIVQDEEMVPVVLMSEKKGAGVLLAPEDEAVPMSIPQALHVQEELGVLPTVSLPQPPQRRRGRFAWGMLLLSVILALLLVLGRSAISLPWSSGQSHAPTTGAKHPQTGAASTPSSTTPAALPTPFVPVGKLLYGASLLACSTQQRSLWIPNPTTQVTCTSSAMQLTTPSGESIGGVFLNSLPAGALIPDNYVLQVQVKESPSSQVAFGIFFRAQTGSAHKGAFSFLINASGRWTGNIYDDTTGQASQLYGRQSPALNASSFTSIDIVVQGSSFSLYFDGVEQGGIKSANYPGGILGLVAEPGTEVQFKNMAIYALPGNG